MRETGYRPRSFTTVMDALCKGVDCLSGTDSAALRNRAVAGLRLCRVCRERLSVRLRELPALFEECGIALGGSSPGGLREKTTGGPLPGMPFNTDAAEARTAIVSVLGSWSGLVAEERGLYAPRRSVVPMAAFLARHADWLAAHPAAVEITEEVARLVRKSRRAVRRDPRRRVPVGPCVESGCHGQLAAYVGAEGVAAAGEIRCGVDPRHTWPGHLWTRLSRSLRQAGPGTVSDDAADATEAGDAATERWLTAADVSRLWSTPIGTVYRLASEQQWRRRTRAGRTYYSESDVHDCFSRRAARLSV
ncbi:hypothetical protein [Streptomyces sp. A5-4]|uniref:hypothetical protein n=1 Tax=Streptomyces sp. A5-4 TaxID=3384771 RepID=UPI003DA9698B